MCLNLNFFNLKLIFKKYIIFIYLKTKNTFKNKYYSHLKTKKTISGNQTVGPVRMQQRHHQKNMVAHLPNQKTRLRRGRTGEASPRCERVFLVILKRATPQKQRKCTHSNTNPFHQCIIHGNTSLSFLKIN